MNRMKRTRLFRGIWRANAIIIFAAGVLSLIMLAFAAVYILKETLREREVTAVVNTDTERHVRESMALGSAVQIAGHPWLLVPLESDQKYDQVYFSKSAVAARNYGFISASAPVRWLYPHNRFLIVDAAQLAGADGSREERATVLISFEVVQKDSNNDERLTPNDLSALVFTKPDGTGSTVVLENVRRIVSQEIISGEISVVYEDNAGYANATFSLKDYSEVKHERMPLPGAGS
jgi:hypothetical protein